MIYFFISGLTKRTLRSMFKLYFSRCPPLKAWMGLKNELCDLNYNFFPHLLKLYPDSNPEDCIPMAHPTSFNEIFSND